MKDNLVFDTTDVDTIAESDHVGAHTLSGTGSLITSGDGDSDNVTNTFEGLDMRSFLFGYDSSGDNWDRIQQVAGAVKVYIDDGDFEVDVVINAEKAEDSAHTSGDVGNYVLSVRMDDVDGSNAALIAGTEGDYQSLFTNAKGELHVRDNDVLDQLVTVDAVLDTIKTDTAAIVVDVAAIETELLDQGTTLDDILADTANIDSVLSALTKAEDSVHSSGDQGIMSLAVRNDAGTPLAADGDYIPLTTDATGAMYVNVTNEISVNDAALANTSIANAEETLDVVSTAQNVVASPLANRKYLFVYNNDNRRMFIGATGVTEANGFPISPGSYMELRAGASVDIEFVSEKLNHSIRTLELS